MPAGQDDKSIPANPITQNSVHFAVAASEANSGTGTPASLSEDVAKNLPKTSTPYPKDNSDHQLNISRISFATEPDHKDGPAAKRRRQVV